MSTTDWNTDELQASRSTTTEFVRREVLPHQDEWEREGMLPRSLSKTAGDLGLPRRLRHHRGAHRRR